MRAPLLALAATAALSSGATGQDPTIPGPSFDSIISLKSVGSPAISPDGRAIAYTVTSTDWTDNRYDTEVWLWREGGTSVQLTRTEKGNSTGPRWSPDGRWIAFLADRGDKQQVHLISAGGGEAWPLTAVKEGVQSFDWSPDGRRVAFRRPEPEPEANQQRKERYGEFAIEDQEFQQSHLWLARVPVPAEPEKADTLPQRLTEGAFHVADFAWSPNSARIAIERRSDPLINSSITADIWLLDVSTKQMTPFVQQPGPDGSPVWSPDSQFVVYSSSGGDTPPTSTRTGRSSSSRWPAARPSGWRRRSTRIPGRWCGTRPVSTWWLGRRPNGSSSRLIRPTGR